jgi:glycosyltransferase involved in cell wall biosynthesis
MRLVVVSHKLCWRVPESPSGFATDGGFPLQMQAISELFDETKIAVPCAEAKDAGDLTALNGKNLRVVALSDLKGAGWRRKLNVPVWLVGNGWTVWREVRRADAVHAPVPGDVGTFGMIFALILRKPLFVRHCGNWLVPRTAAEHFWKWMMERFAGGRNVMLATGGTNEPPSRSNPNVKWIFSTSLRSRELAEAAPRRLPADGGFKMLIACRQEKGKGGAIVLESLPLVLKKFPRTTLDVVGGGSFLEELKELAKRLRVADKVTFHGKVPQRRVVALMRRAHVFCFPTEASEGFPKVVLEALAGGLPVITTKVSVLPQLVGENCGVLLNEATAENLAAAVEKICGDARIYRRMSESAIAAARQFSLENWRDFIGETLRQSWQVASLSSV